MIRVYLNKKQKQNVSGRAVSQWNFVEDEEQNHWVASMNRDDFEDFLKETNCIVYKDQLKNYQHGTICGEFEVET